MQNQTNNPEEVIESADDLIETIVSGLSSAEYEKIRNEAIEKAKTTRHEWRMKGRGKLTCTSCPVKHTSYIPMNKILTGISDDGTPILQNN